jgi:hypothetical protein
MKAFELAVAAVCAALGVRSAVVWARRPFAGRDLVDHLLYAVHLTGRVGLWFAFAAMFVVFGTSEAQGGRGYVDEMNDQQWLLYLIAALGVMQLLGGWFLSRRLEPDDPPT